MICPPPSRPQGSRSRPQSSYWPCPSSGSFTHFKWDEKHTEHTPRSVQAFEPSKDLQCELVITDVKQLAVSQTSIYIQTYGETAEEKRRYSQLLFVFVFFFLCCCLSGCGLRREVGSFPIHNGYVSGIVIFCLMQVKR